MTYYGKKILFIAFLSGVFIMMLGAFLANPWPILARMLVVNEAPEHVDVLITLGGDSDRELYAAELYNLGIAPKVIMSGGGSAADKMAEKAIKKGVRERDIIVERNSKSTYDNAVNSREIVLRENFKSAIVISSPYHMRRSKMVFNRVFKKTGVKLIYCSTSDSGFNVGGQCNSKNDRRIVKREYTKLVYYWFRYW